MSELKEIFICLGCICFVAIVFFIGYYFHIYQSVHQYTPSITSVSIDEEVLSTLNGFYNTENEFQACIKLECTHIYNATAIVRDECKIIEISNVMNGSSNYVKSMNCLDYDGVIHSHPNHTPIFSESDTMSFKKDIKDSGAWIDVLMYDKNGLVYVTKNNFEENKVRI